MVKESEHGKDFYYFADEEPLPYVPTQREAAGLHRFANHIRSSGIERKTGQNIDGVALRFELVQEQNLAQLADHEARGRISHENAQLLRTVFKIQSYLFGFNADQGDGKNKLVITPEVLHSDAYTEFTSALFHEARHISARDDSNCVMGLYYAFDSLKKLDKLSRTQPDEAQQAIAHVFGSQEKFAEAVAQLESLIPSIKEVEKHAIYQETDPAILAATFSKDERYEANIRDFLETHLPKYLLQDIEMRFAVLGNELEFLPQKAAGRQSQQPQLSPIPDFFTGHADAFLTFARTYICTREFRADEEALKHDPEGTVTFLERSYALQHLMEQVGMSSPSEAAEADPFHPSHRERLERAYKILGIVRDPDEIVGVRLQEIGIAMRKLISRTAAIEAGQAAR